MALENFIWYEKYRPRELKEMILSPGYRDTFDGYINNQEIPHLLLYGPPGSGKTTIAHILINKIKSQSILLNASSEDRGIATIRGKVKLFASSEPMPGHLKIIFMDEADGILPDAQRALKNTMETYSSSCRFILTANHVDKIIPEIRSRCIGYEFSQYPIRRALNKIRDILKLENVKADDADVDKLVDRFYPDMRSILNNLQAGSVGGQFNPNLSITLSINVEEFRDLLWKGKLGSMRKMWAGMTDFLWLYKYLFDVFIYEVEEELRPDVALYISEFMHWDAIVVDREINFTGCVISLMRTLKCKISFQS